MRLGEQHDLGSFACGVQALDGWLRNHALEADHKGTARTYVWSSQDGLVIAYFSLAPHLVTRAQAPAKVGRGSPDQIPSILLARLALDSGYQHKPERFGGMLLVEALTVAVEVSKRGGGRLIVVDAIDLAASNFYLRHGFVGSPDPNRLMMKVSDAAVSIGVPWP
jgi:hypothetical protein